MSRHFKTNLRHWLAKVYTLSKKPKKAISDIAKKMTNVELKQSKNITEEKIVDCLFESLEQLKTINADFQEGIYLLQKFIEEHQLQLNQKLRQNMRQFIQKYFAGVQQNARNYQQQVPNIWNQNMLSYDCVCPKTTKDLQFSELKQVCYRCARICHVNCLWGKDHKQQLYQCPMCFLFNCIPNKEVKQIQFAGFLRQIKKDKIQYKINFALQGSLREEELVEVRCVRLCKQSKYELTWPVNCLLTLNSKKIADFKPLSINCSLKKRTDDQINLQRKHLSSNNTLIIEERHQYQQGCRPTVYQNHLVAVLIVKPVSSLQIQRIVMNEMLNIEQSREILLRHFSKGMQDCIIDKIKVTLKCQLYNTKIKIPVRSRHCTSHYQPFDLNGFLLANINIRSSTKRWKCPICRQRAYHLVVDSYLHKFILNKPNIGEIEFDRKGQAVLIEQQDDSDQEEKGYEIIQCENEELVEGEHEEGRLKSVDASDFIEIIEVESESIEEGEESTNKRGFYERKLQAQLNTQSPNKKIKNDNIVSQKNPFHFLAIKQSAELVDQQQAEGSIQSLSLESKYSPNQSCSFRPHKKQRKQKSIKEDSKQFDPMAKTLIPSPAISTVIPQAIRILEKKIPDAPKKPNNIELIELSESQENEPIQKRNAKKLQYHKEQLSKEKKLLGNTFGKVANFQITASDQSIFLSLCDKFMKCL